MVRLDLTISTSKVLQGLVAALLRTSNAVVISNTTWVGQQKTRQAAVLVGKATNLR